MLVERGFTCAKSHDLIDGKDVLDFESLMYGVMGCEVVFDCCGLLGSAETFKHTWRTFEVNVKGTLNVLEAARLAQVPVVFLSLKNEWHNPYMISKRAATELCEMYRDYYGLRVSVVRGLNAYGPGQHWGSVRKVVPTFIVNALQNKPLSIFGDGRQIVDLIHVNDLAEIMIRLYERQCWGIVIDAGTGVPVTVLELARLIIELSKSKSTIDFVPMRMGEPDRAIAIADATQAKAAVDYYPQIALPDGLRSTIDWYRDNWESMRT